MSVFNKAAVNPRLLFQVMLSPATEVIPLLGSGQKTAPDEGKGEVGLMRFLIVSQPELPVPNCSGFGDSAAGELGFAYFEFSSL